MGFSRQLSSALSSYIAGNRLRGLRRFPLVLMLEPLFRCNLECAGCGRIREFRDELRATLTADECLQSAEECPAPVVSITGGEPLIHPEIEQIVAGLIKMKKFVHLCTNGTLLEKSLDKFQPGPYFSFVLHLDAMADSHDSFAGKPGVFDTAIAAMRAAKRRGFSLLVNHTIYRWTSVEESGRLFGLLGEVGIDGLMVSPAFDYREVDDPVFMPKDEANAKFRAIDSQPKAFKYYNTPVYREFLAGRQDLSCTPWSTPTRNPLGWKRPCYLITDGHCTSFRELMNDTDWQSYGTGKDPRCASCMVHCGYEASALDASFRSPRNLWLTARWGLSR